MAAPRELTPSASVRVIRPILTGLRAAGHDPVAIAERAGIPRAALEDADARIAHDAAVRLWSEAVHVTGDREFGLHVAELVQPGAFDVVDYAARSCGTLREGYQTFIRFSRLNHDIAEFRIEAAGDHGIISHRLPGGRVLPRVTAEFIAAAWVVLGRQMTGTDWAPSEVLFAHEAPADLAEHTRIFRAQLRFEAGVTAMRIPNRVLDAPLVKADPGLAGVLMRHAAERLQRLPSLGSFSERVREVLAQRLAGGDCQAEAIAAELQLSPSTLQRRLLDEGTSHKQLLEEIRKQLATSYLTERRLAIAEVAFLLGFSEPSAFHRAFKRWTGLTPAGFRAPL